LLLNGDTSNDARLLPGDVIFIPPVGVTVAVSGEIQRPAIYEVKEGAAASEVLYVAGGLTPQADPRTATSNASMRVAIGLCGPRPNHRAGPVMRLQTGDTLASGHPRVSKAQSLVGTHREGGVQYGRACV
jgi:hypothetical protein